MSKDGAILAGVAVVVGGVVIYLATRPPSPLTASLGGSAATSGLTGLINAGTGLIKALGGSSGASGPPAAYSTGSSPNANSSSPISSDSSGFGITPTEQTNINNYDSQNGGDVVGIAGIDF